MMADMDRDVALKLLRGGKDGIKEWNRRRKAGEGFPDLNNANLSGADLRRTNLSGAHLNSADLSGANLNDANLREAKLGHANLSGADLSGADLSGADLLEANLDHADLSGSNLHRTKLNAANLSGANLREARMVDTILFAAHLTQANLLGARLDGTQFHSALLDEAKLLQVTVNTKTILEDAKVAHCTIERHTLESLKEYGGLTPGARMTMNIVDGVATLRANYSGFLQWVHVIALLVFLYPYLWFVLSHWAGARFNLPEGAHSITLLEALGRFVWNGGENWEAGWDFNVVPFSLFVFALLYNVLRGVLLWKTKTLELAQEASGLPALFSLTGGWGRAFLAAKWGLYVNLIIVAIHTMHFLMQEIPLSP
ncbi:MAG: pentapeptide repeat-containing protein [Phycisphaerae bacterium]|nr:pentapeptide repeat-containing protein [Phycisphaerae bacterium]